VTETKTKPFHKMSLWKFILEAWKGALSMDESNWYWWQNQPKYKGDTRGHDDE